MVEEAKDPLEPKFFKVKISYGFDPEGKMPDGSKEGFFWPQSQSKRKESQAVRRNSPSDFESVYQCSPGQREGSIFLEKDFAYYQQPLTLNEGIASSEVKEMCRKGHGVFQAWDTAFSATTDSAHTVGIAGLFSLCNSYHRGEDPLKMGECESHFDVAILDVYRQKLMAGDIGGKGLMTAVRQQHMKWQPELEIVENKASGITLIQSLPGMDIPVLGVSAKEGKRARAIKSVDGAGSAQGWFQLHRVLFPKYATWLEALKTELKDFTGDESAVTDQVDAIVHLICHAIELGSKTTMLPTGWSPNRAEPMAAMETMREANLEPQNDKAAFLAFMGELPLLSGDPFESSCARCLRYENGFCTVHRRQMVAMDICPSFESRDRNNSFSEVYE